LHIDGKIIGNVIASDDKALLTLSENGVIEGNVNVPFIVLNGKVSGDVHAGERIELAAQAQVIGNVYYNLIEMAMGAEVNGSLVHSAEKDAKPSVVTGIKSDEKKESSDNVVESTILGYLGPEGSK
jgi:cytoskeletal protein CcmA (bactofilin family)